MTALRVLFATDGSDGAAQARKLLESSFDPARTTVEAISVVPRAAGGPGSGAIEVPNALLGKGLSDAAEHDVHEAAKLLRSAGFETVETIAAGHPAETIVTRAIAAESDLILLGTRGLGRLRGHLVGSVSGKVARYAQTSVLVARAAGPIRSILLGYDASPDADEALEQVARLPFREKPILNVCSTYAVVRPLSSGLAPTMVSQVSAAYTDSLRWAREAAEAMAEVAAERLRERGAATTHRTACGPAHEQLAVVAGELSADLLVVGSRGVSAIQRFFLGSTSAALVTQPPTSVLVARGTGG